MTAALHRRRFRLTLTAGALTVVVAGLLAVFWTSVWLDSIGVPVDVVRTATGLVLLFVPGALLAHVLDAGTDTGGRFVLYSGGLGLALLATLALVANVVLPPFGIVDPLGPWPLAILLTATTLVLLRLATARDGTFPDVEVDLVGSAPVLLVLFALPTLAALGAATLRRTGSNAGMYLFVGVLSLVVLLSATRVVGPNHYPLVVFFVAFSAFLHANLLTNHVVGNDIQALYFAAQRLMAFDRWIVGSGGSLYALPVVTAVPATISTVTGLDLWAVFTTVYVLLFALVPVGIFYVGRHVFGANVGLFGGLFFAFYHISLTYTPGKQLVAELFVVLLLGLYFVEGPSDARRKGAAFLLVLGLVFSHYATTFVFVLALFGATFGLAIVDRVVGPVDHRLSVSSPFVLLGAAVAWYAVASQELIGRLASIPASLYAQLVTLVTEGRIVGGAGATYVAEQSTPLEDLTLYLYVLMIAFVGVGLAWRVALDALRAWRGERPTGAELTALGVPLFGFLGLSYVVILNLYADRVYQMVLTVLAPFAAVGYGAVGAALGHVRTRLRIPGPARFPWAPLAAVLVVLLALNTGMAFAAYDEADSAAFNPDAHDSVFPAGERAAASWVADTADVRPNPQTTAEDQLEVRDYPDQTPVFTDGTSYQLFRSVLPTGYYDTETVVLKTEYRLRIDYDRLDEGYVFLRRKAVRDANGRAVPPAYLSSREATAIAEPRNVVYSSGDARIVAAGYGPGTNRTRDETRALAACRGGEQPRAPTRAGACGTGPDSP